MGKVRVVLQQLLNPPALFFLRLPLPSFAPPLFPVFQPLLRCPPPIPSSPFHAFRPLRAPSLALVLIPFQAKAASHSREAHVCSSEARRGRGGKTSTEPPPPQPNAPGQGGTSSGRPRVPCDQTPTRDETPWGGSTRTPSSTARSGKEADDSEARTEHEDAKPPRSPPPEAVATARPRQWPPRHT